MDKEPRAEWTRRCARSPGSEWRVEARDGERRIVWSNEGIFDELVVDYWLHLEQLDERTWWMRVGDARVRISIAEDAAVTVDVQRGFYEAILGGTEMVSSQPS
jgi:hypothetical protein